MEPAVTPDLAVRYLRELSADLVAAAVATAGGRTLAGPSDLATAAVELVARVPGAGFDVVLQMRAAGAVVVVARSDEHAVVAVHGENALAGLVAHDLVTVLGDLATAPGRATEPVVHDVADVTPALVEAVRRAVAAWDRPPQRALPRPDADP